MGWGTGRSSKSRTASWQVVVIYAELSSSTSSVLQETKYIAYQNWVCDPVIPRTRVHEAMRREGWDGALDALAKGVQRLGT
jgi:hypothetical protein